MNDDITWDYSALAESYQKRAPYAPDLVQSVIELALPQQIEQICDVGAGTGFLAKEWAKNDCKVLALEPNDSMRRIGKINCDSDKNIIWHDATASESRIETGTVDLVSFGSSFNVVNQESALLEAKRIAKQDGWIFIVWNHRDLKQKLQHDIEQIIHSFIPNYQYGKRRIDYLSYLKRTHLFSQVIPVTKPFIHEQSKIDVVEAWGSHATLMRQAGDQHGTILDKITQLIMQQPYEVISTRFESRGWLAKFK